MLTNTLCPMELELIKSLLINLLAMLLYWTCPQFRLGKELQFRLEKCLNIVKSGDIILFYTGTSPKLDSKDIRISYKKEYEKIEGNFIYLELSCAEWIVGHNIKCEE